MTDIKTFCCWSKREKQLYQEKITESRMFDFVSVLVFLTCEWRCAKLTTL